MVVLTTLTLVAVVLAVLVRELRRGGYGRPAVPSIAETGAERARALSLASGPARD